VMAKNIVDSGNGNTRHVPEIPEISADLFQRKLICYIFS
jgi:hypothetical protein